MKVTVQLFARARDLAGQSTIELDLPDIARVRDLRRQLGEQVPALQPLLPHLFVAVNADYASNEQMIPPHAVLACFPPVSGG